MSEVSLGLTTVLDQSQEADSIVSVVVAQLPNVLASSASIGASQSSPEES